MLPKLWPPWSQSHVLSAKSLNLLNLRLQPGHWYSKIQRIVIKHKKVQPSILVQWTLSAGASQPPVFSSALFLFQVSPACRPAREGLLYLNKDMMRLFLKPRTPILKWSFTGGILPLLRVVMGLNWISISRSIGKRVAAISASSLATWWETTGVSRYLVFQK